MGILLAEFPCYLPMPGVATVYSELDQGNRQCRMAGT